MNRQQTKDKMMGLLPNHVVFSRSVGSPSAAIGQALDSIEDGANLNKTADRLAAALGWDGSPAFWMALEQYSENV